MSYPQFLVAQTTPMRCRRPQLSRAFLILVLSVMWCGPGSAGEPLQDILQRLKIDEVRHFQYREKRQMALLSHPWIAVGEVFLAPGEILVSQQKPRETLSLISQDRFEHLDLEHGRYYSRVLDDTSQAQGLGALLPLFAGDEQQRKLADQFNTELQQRDARWTLILRPIVSSGNVQEIRLSGGPNQGADKIALEFQDGDSIEWRLRLQASGSLAKQSMLQFRSNFADYGTR